MWIYAQASGQLLNPNGALAGTGYAGRDACKNKPDDQCKADLGPLPCNSYTIGPAMDHPRLGPIAMPLVPDDTSKMCGRSAFYIHGDSNSHPGEASDGCIIMARDIRQRVSNSNDRKLMVVSNLDAAIASVTALGAPTARALAPMPVTLQQLGLPLGLVVVATGIHWFGRDYPGVALFIGWLLCAIAAITVVKAVQEPLTNEVGRYDAAHLFTIAWFVLLTSAMASGSLWNICAWNSTATQLNAFVDVPPGVWILGGITLLSNVGIRTAFALSTGPDKLNIAPGPTAMDDIVKPPLDPDGSTKMAAAQYVIFNLLALVVYAIAIARVFSVVKVGELVGTFPAIPEEMLGLFAVSAGGFVVTSATPALRK